MYSDGQPQPGRLAQALPKSEVVDPWKLGQPGVAQEGFEANDAASRKLFHIRHAVGHKPAPQCKIRYRGRFERLTLSVELSGIHGARSRIERHVEEHRSPARRESAAARG